MTDIFISYGRQDWHRAQQSALPLAPANRRWIESVLAYVYYGDLNFVVERKN